jgi:hypothetical protein
MYDFFLNYYLTILIYFQGILVNVGNNVFRFILKFISKNVYENSSFFKAECQRNGLISMIVFPYTAVLVSVSLVMHYVLTLFAGISLYETDCFWDARS